MRFWLDWVLDYLRCLAWRNFKTNCMLQGINWMKWLKIISANIPQGFLCDCGCNSPSHNEPWLQLITLSSPSLRPQLTKPQTSSNPRWPLINPHGGRCRFTAIKVPDGPDCMLVKGPAVNINWWFVFLPPLFTSSLYYLRLV